MPALYRRDRLSITLLFATIFGLFVAGARAADDKRDALWTAVRAGDVKAVQAALDKGADVNAKNEIGVSALWIAASKGKLPVMELLVKKGADVNVRDGIWYGTPLTMSDKVDVARMLIKAGAKDFDAALGMAAMMGNQPMVEMILKESKPSHDALDAAFYTTTTTAKNPKVADILKKAGAKTLPLASEKDKKAWAKLAGTYESDGGSKMLLAVKDVGLATRMGVLKQTGPDTFAPLGSEGTQIRIVRKGDAVDHIVMSKFTAEYSFYRFTKPEVKAAPADVASGAARAPLNWPQFRGPDGTGVADGQQPPISWNVKTGQNVRWKTPIPGLGHSLPGRLGQSHLHHDGDQRQTGRENQDRQLRRGRLGRRQDEAHLAGALPRPRQRQNPLDPHGLRRRAQDQAAPQGQPGQLHAGRRTAGTSLACFGSEGLYCYDFDGKQLWKRDLEHARFELRHRRGIRMGLRQFAAHSRRTGHLPVRPEPRIRSSPPSTWRTAARSGRRSRDEIPSWSSPVIWHNSQARRTRHQRRPVRPRLRPENGERALAAREKIRSHHPHAGRRQGPALHHQRQPPDSADLRHQAGGDGRHLAQIATGEERTASSGANSAAAPTCRRRSSTARTSTPARTQAS